jgi:hypothetical protein
VQAGSSDIELLDQDQGSFSFQNSWIWGMQIISQPKGDIPFALLDWAFVAK